MINRQMTGLANEDSRFDGHDANETEESTRPGLRGLSLFSKKPMLIMAILQQRRSHVEPDLRSESDHGQAPRPVRTSG